MKLHHVHDRANALGYAFSLGYKFRP